MRFLADMGVDQRVVAWLRAAGHDAIHLRDEGLHRLPDDDIFDKAIAEARIILTFDLDFGEIAALASGRVASVILFRLPDARYARVIERLQAVLPTSTEALAAGAVVIETPMRPHPLCQRDSAPTSTRRSPMQTSERAMRRRGRHSLTGSHQCST